MEPARRCAMSNWLHNLPVAWMAVAVFGATFALAGVTFALVDRFKSATAMGAFKAVTPGILSPLGVLIGLFVAFTAAQVWTDTDKAHDAVNREASALRSAVILAGVFGTSTERNLRGLIHAYITESIGQEWPAMAAGSATLTTSPATLNQALRSTLALTPANAGQEIAQREIVAALERTLEARRQRVLVSQSQVDPTKWVCLALQAACAFLAIAIIHAHNRLASALTLATFAAGVAAAVLLILANDRPFTGELEVKPEPLLQVMPALEPEPAAEP